MRHSAKSIQSLFRRNGVAMMCVMGLMMTTACLPSANPAAPSSSAPTTLPEGAFYLRTVDGTRLPVTVAGGMRIESGYVVTDASAPGAIGFGESVGRNSVASVRLATGTARVLGRERMGSVAAVSWQAGTTAADSVLWSADSVIVYRTGAAPSVAGAGHRFIYTRATPADTL
jgi:hypothetical protein